MFSKKSVLEHFAKLTEKDLCPSPTLVFYWQFYEIFENTFFTEHFRATAFDEEAWWSKILIPSSFLKKIFVEIIGVFNSESCWKKELCNILCWPLGCTLHVNFQPGLKFIPGRIQLYLWSKLSSNELKIQTHGYFNSVLTAGWACYNSACFYHRLRQIASKSCRI